MIPLSVRCINPTIIVILPEKSLRHTSRRRGLIFSSRSARARTTVIPFFEDSKPGPSQHSGYSYSHSSNAYGVASAAKVVQPAGLMISESAEFWKITRASALQGRPRYTSPAREYPDAASTVQVSKTYQLISVERVRELAVMDPPLCFAAIVQTPNQAAASPKIQSTPPSFIMRQ